ncbi:MAG: multiheme c-type cytochrome [Myxococcota bacterium]
MRLPALTSTLVLILGCATERASTPPAAPPAPATATALPRPAVKVNEVALALADAGIALDADDPATCAPCHTAVVAEWQESLHSRSHHAKDPLYAAMRTLRTTKQGPQIPGKCAVCHNPRDGQDHDSKAAQSGVSCATCHQLDGVHLGDERKGTGALVKGPVNVFRGPHDIPDGTSPLHGNGPALPALVDGKSLCLACHAEEKNPAGLATCSTGVEHASIQDNRACAECHMPVVETPSGPVSSRPTHRSHRFLGPHQAQRLGEVGLLAEAVKLSGRFDGAKLVARLENTSGHSFPTGFPARMAVLDLRAFDAKGKELYRNVTTEPMKEHPDAVLNRAYVDAEGKPALAPFATREVRDSRLKPGEVREVVVEVPAKAVKAELALRFFLAAPPMLKAIEYSGPEAKPVALPPVVVTRP